MTTTAAHVSNARPHQESGEIRLVGVTKQFGNSYAVQNIDLIIPHGSYCCLLGPSGCGKTTILRMIAGHETPTSGEIYIGNDMVVGRPPVERGTAMMFQSYALFPHLTILDNVAFYLKMRNVGKEERRRKALEMLRRVQLDHLKDRMPAQLSGGQQQRVALARSLITFVHVTHTQPEAIALADMVVVMDTGRIEQADTANVIFNKPTTPYVARFMGGQNVLTGTVESNSGGFVRLKSADGAAFEVKAGDAAAAVGSKLSVSVRRDHVALRRGEGSSDVNSIAGVVTATEYQGSYVKVTLDTAGGIFVANVSDRAYFAEQVDTGDKVVASWSTDDVHVLSKVDTGAAGDPYLDGGH